MKIIVPMFLLLTGCAAPKWGGLYAGMAEVTPVNRWAAESGTSAEINAIWLLPTKASLQTEIILPVTEVEHPLLRVALAWRLF